MKRSIYLMITMAAVALAGCAKDDVDKVGPSQEEVVFNGGFSDKTTRTSLGDTSLDLIPVLWSPGDAIGVFTYTPGATAVNAKATLTEGAGARNGRFTSLGITMAETDNVFYLYYPYDKDALSSEMSRSQTSVKFVDNGGDPYILGALPANQTQKTPNDTGHFGKYGYSVAISEPADKGSEVAFTMEHVLTYLELSLYGSGNGLSGYYVEEITLTAPVGKHIAGPFKGKFDGTYVAVGELETNYSNVVSLEVEQPENLTAGADQAQKFVLSMLPADLSADELKIVVKVSQMNGALKTSRFYAATLGGKDFRSDCLTRIKASLDSWERIYPLRAAPVWEEGVTLQDVELMTGPSGTDLSAQLANSYIIRSGGTYSIPAKKPDGLWVDGIEANNNNYITFTVPAGVKGNVLLALYRWDPDDSAGNNNTILYSWHLWISDPQDLPIGVITVLDQALGATATESTDLVSMVDALGYYYQWGRKDPFIRAGELVSFTGAEQESGAFTEKARAMTMNTATFGPELKWKSFRNKQSYEDTYDKPTSFIDGMILGVSGGYTITKGHYNLPSYNGNMLTTWASHADPCPRGYHVSSPEELALMTSGPATYNPTYRVWNYNNGLHIQMSGYRNNEFGNLRALGGQGLAWSNSTKNHSVGIGVYAYTLHTDPSDPRYSEGNNGRISGGRPIRCVKD